jgi:hypothetical protein
MQRVAAKKHLNAAFGLPENTESNTVNRAVDCIIGAALLEMVVMMHEAQKSQNARGERNG